MKKFWFQMRLTYELKQALQQMADKKGVSMSYLVESILQKEMSLSEGQRQHA